LLHPAFMVRFLALAELAPFGPPRAIAVANRFTVFLPKAKTKNLFEPPGFLKPATDRPALAELSRDIEAVVSLADQVISLESRFPRPVLRSSPPFG
jgi:hypothetical protein